LKRDRTKRLGAKKDADEIKEHPWFNGVDWDEVFNRKLKPPIPEKRKLNLNGTTKINDKAPEQAPKTKIDNWSFVKPEGL